MFACAWAGPTGVSDGRAVFSAAAADGRAASVTRFDLVLKTRLPRVVW